MSPEVRQLTTRHLGTTAMTDYRQEQVQSGADLVSISDIKKSAAELKLSLAMAGLTGNQLVQLFRHLDSTVLEPSLRQKLITAWMQARFHMSLLASFRKTWLTEDAGNGN